MATKLESFKRGLVNDQWILIMALVSEQQTF